jgi:peroxiredoxin
MTGRLTRWSILSAASLCLVAAALLLFAPPRLAAQKPVVWNAQEKSIIEQIRTLRQLPDDVRARTTQKLAIEIRELPAAVNKVGLAAGLASLSTEGDFGRDTLQEVATTLTQALAGHPPPAQNGHPAGAYVELAQLVRYEHVKAALNSPQFAAAMAELEADDRARQQADFTLHDLRGKAWTLSELRGKVVLVNFWATWCPPCRKEMPDLEALYRRFQAQGLVILAISDEKASKVEPFVAERKVTYPVLLDPGDRVNMLYRIYGIPKSFIYDRQGRLAAEAIDMRTRRQFLALLAQAGLQ